MFWAFNIFSGLINVFNVIFVIACLVKGVFYLDDKVHVPDFDGFDGSTRRIFIVTLVFKLAAWLVAAGHDETDVMHQYGRVSAGLSSMAKWWLFAAIVSAVLLIYIMRIKPDSREKFDMIEETKPAYRKLLIHCVIYGVICFVLSTLLVVEV
jgi:hypothetical protein